jgi:hypothetical protein
MTFDPREEMTEAERACRDSGWLTPLEAFDLRQEIERLREIEAAARDSARGSKMSERADSMLVFDLRAFARDYSGSPLSGRLKTAANELDRLYEVERRAFGGMGRGIGETPKETPIPHGKETENAAVSFGGDMLESAATALLRYNRMIPLGQYLSDAPGQMQLEALAEASAILVAAIDPNNETLCEAFALRRWKRLMPPQASWSASDRSAWIETARLDLANLQRILSPDFCATCGARLPSEPAIIDGSPMCDVCVHVSPVNVAPTPPLTAEEK